VRDLIVRGGTGVGIASRATGVVRGRTISYRAAMAADDLGAAIHRQIADGMLDLGVPKDFYLRLLRQEDD
jgi:hypothetical protein